MNCVISRSSGDHRRLGNICSSMARWENMSGRKWSLNFSSAEIDLLELLSGECAKKIECKKIDASVIEKEKMLKDVAEHFKALSATDRNVESLKILWKRLRSELKKKDAVLKRRFRKTVIATRIA